MLTAAGYPVHINGNFDQETVDAVMKVQSDGGLKKDGIVGSRTWTYIQSKQSKASQTNNILDKGLKESDFVGFAKKYNLEIAVVKAVQEVEAGGRGFAGNDIKLLFEGHVFWKQLKAVGIDPNSVLAGNEDILHPKYIAGNKLYKLNQMSRLNKAIQINASAAHESASYGLFQIMGFHWKSLGFSSPKSFYDYLSVSEGNQLDCFGKFLEKNNLLIPLRQKNWAKFARGYNGPAYATNKYDIKLEKAYQKFLKIG